MSGLVTGSERVECGAILAMDSMIESGAILAEIGFAIL